MVNLLQATNTSLQKVQTRGGLLRDAVEVDVDRTVTGVHQRAGHGPGPHTGAS